jgi:hypothetical protein
MRINLLVMSVSGLLTTHLSKIQCAHLHSDGRLHSWCSLHGCRCNTILVLTLLHVSKVQQQVGSGLCSSAAVTVARPCHGCTCTSLVASCQTVQRCTALLQCALCIEACTKLPTVHEKQHYGHDWSVLHFELSSAASFSSLLFTMLHT